MSFVAGVYKVTSAFMNDYPEERYPELMHKLGRPYSCLLVDTHCDYYICVPFRSHIHHKNTFLFHGTVRSLKSKSGLDYSKIILINKAEYLDDSNVIVDKDEYNEVQRNIDRIVKESVSYVEDYIGYVSGSKQLHPKEFQRRYSFQLSNIFMTS